MKLLVPLLLILAIPAMCFAGPKLIIDENFIQADRYIDQADKLVDTGSCREAIPLYNKALSIHRTIHSKEIGIDLLDMARCFDRLDQFELAEQYFRESIDVTEKEYGKLSVEYGITVDNYATYLLNTSRLSEALLWSEIGKVNNEYLFIIAKFYPKSQRGVAHLLYAGALTNMALSYACIGNFTEAESMAMKARYIFIEHYGKNHPEVATLLSNLASIYFCKGQYLDAEKLLLDALEISEKAYGRKNMRTAVIISSLAVVYVKLERYALAESLCKESLELIANISGRDSRFSVIGHLNLANLYKATNQYSKSMDAIQLPLKNVHRFGSTRFLPMIYTEYSDLLEKQGNSSAAVFFGKQAVNLLQGMRQNVAGLGKNTLKAFDDSIEGSYKMLASLLISQGRLPEAQRVQELLKEQEYFQFVTRSANSADIPSGRSSMTSFEAAQEKQLQEAEKPLASFATRRSFLQNIIVRTPLEEQELSSMNDKLDKAAEEYKKTVDRIVVAFGKLGKTDAKELKEATGLQDDLRELRELGEEAVALYTLTYKDRYYLILITPDYRKAYSSDISAADLAGKIQTLRNQLTKFDVDPQPLAKELYKLLLAPAEKELESSKASTLLWHLDGALRYLPVAALYDGNGYLVEKYRNVIYTSASKARLKDQPKATWLGLGLGVSKQHIVDGRKFDALPAVPIELATVIRSDTNFGVIPGESYLDEPFTWKLLQTSLQTKGKYRLVHIASHFQFAPGNDTQSFLLLGDGKTLSLADIEKQNNLFGGVDLLTLSACDTATGGGNDATGMEVDGLSILAQRQGAKAVMATLWPVSDDSTALLMQQFYKLREEKQLSKAEALRQAQMVLLKGTIKGLPELVTNRGVIDKDLKQPRLKRVATNPEKPFAHPYFWAPFILMGNWR